MSIRYIGQKLAQQVSSVQGPDRLSIRREADLMRQIDEELMSASGAFSLDQVSLGRQVRRCVS